MINGRVSRYCGTLPVTASRLTMRRFTIRNRIIVNAQPLGKLPDLQVVFGLLNSQLLLGILILQVCLDILNTLIQAAPDLLCLCNGASILDMYWDTVAVVNHRELKS